MKSFYFKQSHPNKVELEHQKRQHDESEVTEIFNLRIRSSCLLYKEIYFQLGVIHIDGILRCFNSIVFVVTLFWIVIYIPLSGQMRECNTHTVAQYNAYKYIITLNLGA